MAAMPAAHAATQLTPPSSSHGDANGTQWNFGNAPAGKPEVSSLLASPGEAEDLHVTEST